MAVREENTWYKPDVRIECCTDGVRPAVVRVEAEEE